MPKAKAKKSSMTELDWGEDEVIDKKAPEYNHWRVRKPKKFKLGDKTGGPRYRSDLFFGDPERDEIPLQEMINCVNEGNNLGSLDEVVGWHHLEATLCALVLSKYGAGQPEIVGYHCPEKVQMQLNGLMQKLYGMQSMAGNSDFRTPPYEVWLRNALNQNNTRKNGVVIKSGKANSTKEKKLNREHYFLNERLANCKIPVIENRSKNYTKMMFKSMRQEYIIRQEMGRRNMKTNVRFQYTGRKIYFEKFLKPLEIIPKIQTWKYEDEFKCPMKQDNIWGQIRINENYNVMLRDQLVHWCFLNGWAFDCYNDYPDIHQSFDECPCLARIDQFEYFPGPNTYYELTPDAVPIHKNEHYPGAKKIAEIQRQNLTKGPDPVLVQKTREEFEKEVKEGKFDHLKPSQAVREASRLKEQAVREALGQDVEETEENNDPKFLEFKLFMEYEKADPGNVLRHHYSEIDLEVAKKVVEHGSWEPFADEIAEMKMRNAPKGRIVMKSKHIDEDEEEVLSKGPEKMDVDEPEVKQSELKQAEEQGGEEEDDETSTFSKTKVASWTNNDLIDYLRTKDFSQGVVDKVRAAALQGAACLNLSEAMAENIFGDELPEYDMAIMKAIRLYGFRD